MQVEITYERADIEALVVADVEAKYGKPQPFKRWECEGYGYACIPDIVVKQADVKTEKETA
jgi:hypothetical protein